MTPALTMDHAAWQEAERERAFWQHHHAEFADRYVDQFVAVKDEQVIAAAYDLRDLLDQLRARDVNPKDVWIRFFAPKSAVALL
jgi:hypothetical protein